MRKILVPTDFSKAADNALDWAIDLAKQYGSSISLLHVYQVPNPTGYVLSLANVIRENAEKDMLKRRQHATEKLGKAEGIEVLIHRGHTIPFITDIAERNGFDLIVMGMKGVSALREVLLGSMAKGVLQHTMVPLLVVPLEMTTQPIKKIVFAVDDGEISSHKVVWLLTKMAKTNQAEVMVYHLDRGKKDSGIDPTIDLFLEGIESTYHIEAEGGKVHKSISHFVQANAADMLCLIRREKGFFTRLFHPSKTIKEVFQCTVPLLVLHDEEPKD